jgi:hypothetical protein
MTRTGIVRTVRDRVRPHYHAWRVPVIRASLAGVGVAVWAKPEGIDRSVRVRAVRRLVLKDRVWFRIPFQPAVRFLCFLWLYVVKRGFLDGRHDFSFCWLIAMHEILVDAKVMELRLQIDLYETTGREEP